MPNCEACGKPQSTESMQTGDGDMLIYFCMNPECEEYDAHLAGMSREEALEELS